MSIEEMKDRLREDGYVIIPNVLNDEECNEMNCKMFETLSYITQNRFQENDTTTWREYYELMPKNSMLIQNWSFGHAQYIWDIRQNPKVVNIFAQLWNVNNEDLLVSFDGTSIHLPPEITGKGWREKARSLNLHCDQALNRNEFECYQGWITSNDIREYDGTLTVLKGSHRMHAQFADYARRQKKLGKSDVDWYKLDDAQMEWFANQGLDQVYIECPKGSLVLWDSRTIHCGVQPSRKRTEANLRNIIYVCYTPRSLATETNLRQKIQWFENLDMTSHWPHKGKKFPKTPRLYGPPPTLNTIPPPVLTELGRRLVGY